MEETWKCVKCQRAMYVLGIILVSWSLTYLFCLYFRFSNLGEMCKFYYILLGGTGLCSLELFLIYPKVWELINSVLAKKDP